MGQPTVDGVKHGLRRRIRVAGFNRVHHRGMPGHGAGLHLGAVGFGIEGKHHRKRGAYDAGERVKEGIAGHGADRHMKAKIGFGELAAVVLGLRHGRDGLAQLDDIGAGAVRAAMAAAMGSTARRTVVICAMNSRSRPTLTRQDRTSGSSQFQFDGSKTMVPNFILEVTMPLAASVLMISLVTTRETPNFFSISASDGIRSPGLRAPERISAPSTAAILS